MTRAEWFRPKFRWLKGLALLGLLGVVAFAAGDRVGDDNLRGILMLGGFFAFAPVVVWFSFMPILHWKDRYVGRHPNLWGGFMVFETSGFTRLIYWFVHLLADYRARGPYRDVP
jgi:hypothetical protein